MYKTILSIRKYSEEIKRGLIGGFTIFSLTILFFTPDSKIDFSKKACLKWEYSHSEHINVCSIYNTSTNNSIPYGSLIELDIEKK
ncbi:hypothetical protein [Bacillus sp. EAC]|uniref:hypothetical protein n=1 Tax=Bacillus sp. EAC TaxID=1978338 RepID=UPI000B44648B|nr:hypothetical protein [Bacillus sp. EAC]